jgi:hypothetical protein
MGQNIQKKVKSSRKLLNESEKLLKLRFKACELDRMFTIWLHQPKKNLRF